MNLTNEFIKVLKLKHTDKGHFGEQLGMAWLLKNGYWVFKNLAPQGPIDCVAVKQGTGEVVLVDIKVLSRHKNGYIRSKALTELQKKIKVRLLYVDTDNFECRWKDTWSVYMNKLKNKSRNKKNGQFIRSELKSI